MPDQPRPTRTFRAARVRFDPLRAGRQSQATRAAIEALGAEAAMRLLNEPEDGGMRPIDLAGESEGGLERFNARLAAMSRPPSRDPEGA